METPKRPSFTVEVDLEDLYKVLHNNLDDQTHKTFLEKIYDKAADLETLRNELEGRISKKEEAISIMDKMIRDWEHGEENIISNLYEQDDMSEIIDVFFIMIDEYSKDFDHEDLASNRINARLPLHKNACDAIARFMADLLGVMMRKVAPDDEFVYLHTNELTKEEREKIERLWIHGEDERVAINKSAIAFNPESLHIEGNQVLIDPKSLDPRIRQTIRKALDPEKGSDASIALPVRALVQTGESVSKSHIKRVSFPEEDQGREIEEVSPEDYGISAQSDSSSSTGNKEISDDDLPF